MESGFNGATFSQIVNTALYIVSGFFFGIFASRNSLFSVIRIRNAFIEKDFSLTSVFGIAFSVYSRCFHLLRRVAFLFFQRLEKSVRKVKKARNLALFSLL